MFRKNAPDILAVIGLIGVGYGIYQIDTNIAAIVLGGVLFLLGLLGSLR